MGSPVDLGVPPSLSTLVGSENSGGFNWLVCLEVPVGPVDSVGFGGSRSVAATHSYPTL